MLKNLSNGVYAVGTTGIFVQYAFKALGATYTNPGYLYLDSNLGCLLFSDGELSYDESRKQKAKMPKKGDTFQFVKFPRQKQLDLGKPDMDGHEIEQVFDTQSALIAIATGWDARVKGSDKNGNDKNLEDEQKHPTENLRGKLISSEDAEIKFQEHVLKTIAQQDSNQILGSFTAVELRNTWLSEPIVIPSGVSVVYGGSNRGKSSFITELALQNKEKGRLVSFGEPDMISISDSKALARALNRSLFLSGDEVIFVDSARCFLYGPSSSTGQGGVNNEIFVMFSKISSELAKIGKTLVISINPMSSRAEVCDSIAIALEGSVSSLFNLGYEGCTRIPAFTADFTSRLFNKRTHHQINFKQKEDRSQTKRAFVNIDRGRHIQAFSDPKTVSLIRLYKEIIGG